MASPEFSALLEGLRAGGPDLGAPPAEARAGFDALLATIPVADDVVSEVASLDGVPALRMRTSDVRPDRALLYLHGGGYVVGSAAGYCGLASELGRASDTTVFSLDYRLAPENPYPAAVDDAAAAYLALVEQGFAPDRIVIGGDSAGGGLVLATLLMLRDRGQEMPAGALLISPWADLSCTADTMEAKAPEDPSLNRHALGVCAKHYLNGADPETPLASPVFADLSGLPPLLIQVGSAEILLDDAIGVSRAAALAGVDVTLRVWAEMVHVWHAFAFMLPEGRQAIAEAGVFLARAFDEASSARP